MFSALTASSKELFWNEVEKTPTSYSPERPVVVQGKLVAENAHDLQKQMFNTCSKAEDFATRLFSNPPMKVLDLGAGVGANTLPMAKSGAHVTAIDQSKELLTVFANQSTKIKCPSKNLRLRRGDVTTMESYGGPFNLVVAVDILPYIPPAHLRSTMEKIQKCLEDRGLLIGTIFSTTSFAPVTREFLEQLGAHFYEGGHEFVVQLLKHSGFTVTKLEERAEGGFRFQAVKA